MNITFLYFKECPSHDMALERLQTVLAEEEITANIEIISVETEEQAHQWKFAGSPTIRVEGQDIDPPTEDQYRLTCRVYQLEDGRISPLPSPQMIRQALQRATS